MLTAISISHKCQTPVLSNVMSKSDSCYKVVLRSKSLKLRYCCSVIRREIVNKDKLIRSSAQTCHLGTGFFYDLTYCM